MRSIPVLMYHHVLPKAGFIASSVEQFESQMKYLAEYGWHTLSAEEFEAFCQGRYTPPKRSVLITFDDGWRDNYVYAYPILKRYGLKAMLFLVTEWIEKASEFPEIYEPHTHSECKQMIVLHPGKVVLAWDEVEEMKDVFSYHSHTHTHREGYFSQCSWEEEFTLSKEVLKRRLGIESSHFCWPRGKYNENLVQLAQKHGYTMLYTTQRGINTGEDALHIKRLAVKKNDRWLAKNLKLFSSIPLGYLYGKIKSK